MSIFRYISLMIILSCIGNLSYASTNSYNNTGIEQLKKGDYISAIVYLEQAYSQEPDSGVIKKNLAIAYSNHGVNLMDEGKPDSALKKFAKARDLFPDDIGFRNNSAKAYNQLAIEALDKKSFIVAENYFYSALRLQPEEITIRSNLSVCLTNYGVQHYKKKEYELAKSKFIDAISFDESNATAHVYLGSAYYYTQELEKALFSYRNALKQDPKLDYAKKKIKALEKEIDVEKDLTGSSYSIFKILYDSNDEKVDLGSIQKALWDSYYEIGSLFQYYPRHNVVVIIYSPDEFKKIRDTPNWVAGLYDGKIRIPFPEGLSMNEVEKIIRHEYTHVIIHDMSKGKCVNWLNEGLAKAMEYTDEDTRGPNYKILKEAYKKEELNGLNTLAKNFIFTDDPRKAALAYQQSLSLVEFLIQQYGFYKIRNMIEQYANGKTTEEIIKKEFYQTKDQFMKDWKQYVGQNVISE